MEISQPRLVFLPQATNLVGDDPCHVSLRALERSESFTKVKLDIVSFSFHAHAKQYPALAIKVQPILAW